LINGQLYRGGTVTRRKLAEVGFVDVEIGVVGGIVIKHCAIGGRHAGDIQRNGVDAKVIIKTKQVK
jgi:hypothetical protein